MKAEPTYEELEQNPAEYEAQKSCLSTGADVYRHIVESSHTGIIVFQDGKIAFVNERVCHFLGYAREELVSRPFTDFIHPNDHSKIDLSQIDKEDSAPDKRIIYTFRALLKNGDIKWVETNSAHFIWEGRPAILNFIADAKIQIIRNDDPGSYANLEYELMKTRSTYQDILDSIKDGFFEVDLAGNLIFFNNCMCEMADCSADELMGLHYREYTSEKTANRLFDFFHNIFRTGESGEIDDYEIIRKDGVIRVLSVSTGLIRDRHGSPIGFRGIARDVTARKRAEDELEKINNNLELMVSERTSELEKINRELTRAKKVADDSSKAKSEFLANMSHEIRTPLNAILGISDLIVMTDEKSRQKEYIDILRSASTSLLGLINDILDFSKFDAGKLAFESIPFSIHEMIEEISDMFLEKNMAKGLELIVDISPEVPGTVIADPLRLRQVLSNLVANAFKFTRKGEIAIGVRKKQEDENSMELEFSIKDTGIGIDPKLFKDGAPHLFDAFAQADGSTTRKYGGTGLGLAISKKIITAMGGDIRVESTPRKGSTFRFTSLFKSAGVTAPPSPVLPRALSNSRALIIENNPSTLMILKRYMESFGFVTELAASAETALKKFDQSLHGEHFDIIITNLKLDGEDGIKTAEILKNRSNFPAPPMIALSATNNKTALSRAKEAGLDHVLLKPVKQSRLFNTILEIFGSEFKPVNHTTDTADSPDDFSESLILLTEDNPVNCMVATEILRKTGVRIDIASNGLEAVAMATATSYDLILMDIQMPEMDGLEATRQLRKRFTKEELPVIAMTAHAMSGDREKCIASGMNDYMPKPVDKNRLLELLRNYLPLI